MALDASLRRLHVDTIDLYRLHAWDPLTPIAETLHFLDDAVRAGKILYVGLSNLTGWQLQKTVDLAQAHNLACPVASRAAGSSWNTGPSLHRADHTDGEPAWHGPPVTDPA